MRIQTSLKPRQDTTDDQIPLHRFQACITCRRCDLFQRARKTPLTELWLDLALYPLSTCQRIHISMELCRYDCGDGL